MEPDTTIALVAEAPVGSTFQATAASVTVAATTVGAPKSALVTLLIAVRTPASARAVAVSAETTATALGSG